VRSQVAGAGTLTSTARFDEAHDATARNSHILCSIAWESAQSRRSYVTLLPEIGTYSEKQVVPASHVLSPIIGGDGRRKCLGRRAQAVRDRLLHASVVAIAPTTPESQGVNMTPSSQSENSKGRIVAVQLPQANTEKKTAKNALDSKNRWSGRQKPLLIRRYSKTRDQFGPIRDHQYRRVSESAVHEG